MINMTTSKQIDMNRNSSKGNQLKWFDQGTWYKADYLGYEGLSEYVVSQLLKKTNVPEFADYQLKKIQYQGKIYNGCASENFLQDGAELITLEKLFRKFKGIDLAKEIAGWETSKKIQFVVEGVEQLTGLTEFGKYLTMILELDAIFLNEDRHMHNIAVIYDRDNTFKYCPVFDNGSALFSDTIISYGLNVSLDECYATIEAKPFSISFDEQMDAAENLYGVPLKCWFSANDAEDILKKGLDFYPESIISRVSDLIHRQIRKYKYLMTNSF